MKIGKHVRIRAMEREDLPQVANWLNDPEVNQHIATAAMMSHAAELKWFEGALARKSEQVFMIDRRDPMHPDESQWVMVGGAGLHGISPQHGSASFGVYIGEPGLWGKGLGSEATALVLDFALGELRLHRVELEVFCDNARAIKSYKKLGFVVEGTKREAFFRHGVYRDALIMSMLAPDWCKRRDLRRNVFLDDTDVAT